MVFVYATDLHGDEGKYAKALALCEETSAKILHVGADILPKGYSMQPRQKDFIKKFLPKFIKGCTDKGVRFLAMFGNDDLWTRKPLYREKCGDLLDEKPVEVGGFMFTGYPYVPDYPFGLKTACKYDYEGWEPEPYIHVPVEVTEAGIVPIDDVKAYFKKKGTIEDDLRNRKALPNEIVSIHSPPTALGLDVCLDKREVGSTSVRRWIGREQPYMVLSGHIHECPWATGLKTATLNRTVVVQPGQYLSAATVDPSRLETFSEDDLARHPWVNTARLRAAVIDVAPGVPPKVEIVER